MKKFLLLVILLLTLLPVARVSAQNWVNESMHECEDEDGFKYMTDLPCDGFTECREWCESCESYQDCEDIDAHKETCYQTCIWCDSRMTYIKWLTHDCMSSSNGPNDPSGSICIFCGMPLSMCTCSGPLVNGNSQTTGIGGGVGDSTSGNVGSYHPDNNATTTEITPPLLPVDYHMPEANEKLFKDNLPAQTLKQECKMTCVPTAMASIISMLGSDWSVEEIRDQIEQNYLNTKPEGYDLCKYGVLKGDLDNVMYKASFYETSIEEIRNNIDEGNPCVAVINIGTNIMEEMHMIEIVGYFVEPEKEQIVFKSDGSQIVKTQEPVNAYQCINPGTGKYETHYDYEFQKYQDMIYVKYNAK